MSLIIIITIFQSLLFRLSVFAKLILLLFILVLLLELNDNVNSSLISEAATTLFNDKDNFTNNKPLLLTPFITSGNITEAQQLCRVDFGRISSKSQVVKDAITIESYSGFLTVNDSTNANLFFWYFPSTAHEENKTPLILWLQGGPGTSSMFGLFVENGPFVINKDLELSIRNNSWTQSYSMLYIDSPVGSGFSFTDVESGYATNQEEVAKHLLNALLQFFQLFPNLQGTDVYIAGESYAGKYVPSISYKIHEENLKTSDSSVKINLKGLIIGAGFSDPVSMIGSYGEYLYNMGLIDEPTRNQYDESTTKAIKHIENGEFKLAGKVMDELIGGEETEFPTLLKNVTGYDFYYNVLQPNIPQEHLHYIKFIEQIHIKQAIHVGTNATFYNQSTIVPKYLEDDIFQSVKPTIEKLLNLKQYSILLYVGQFDIVVPHLAIYNFIKSMSWDLKEEFFATKRQIWYSKSKKDPNNHKQQEIAGYIKSNGNLTFVILRNAGHNVPFDTPENALELITKFIEGEMVK